MIHQSNILVTSPLHDLIGQSQLLGILLFATEQAGGGGGGGGGGASNRQYVSGNAAV